MKKQLLLFVLMLLPMLASADTVEIDGIYYNLVNKVKQAEVTSNPNMYSSEVVIPSSVTYNDVEYSVTRIGNIAFQSCSSLTSITIPNSVTSIGDYAFGGCRSLTSITIPNSVTSIGKHVFQYCSSLTSITIPNSVTSIASSAFSNCSQLTTITIPNSVTSIGDWAFNGCSSLSSITIPNSVTTIGDYAFNGCSSLPSITIPNSVTSICEDAFNGCSSLTSITIPNSVTSIGSSAFRGCSSLTSITIPNSVTSIDGYAFENCTSLTSIIIGSGVQTIYKQAFKNCPNLNDAYCYAENIPNTQNDAFDDAYPEYATLHVPDKSLQAYKNTEPWSQFGTIVGISGGTPETPKCATPTISYENNKLTFSTETEDVEFVYEITDEDVKKGYTSEVELSVTYRICVYATKTGYDNSDVATATLCWIDKEGVFTPDETTSAVALAAMPVLIQNNGGMLTVQGAQDGTPVSVYTIAGTEAGSAVSQNSCATISTSMQQGDIAIVRIGNRSVKVVLK